MPGLVKDGQNADAGVGIPSSHRTLLSTAVDIIDDEGNNIGFITQYTENENRPTTLIRHLNALDAGRIVEQAPSPAAKTINCNGFALFNKQLDGSLVQRIGGSSTYKAMKTLEEQKLPFSLVEQETNPVDGTSSVTTSHECWITSRSKPVNIGTATVAESCTIQVTWTD